MIEIILSDMAYENDVRPLVKAFYPEEESNISTIRIDFGIDKVSINIKENNGESHNSYISTPSSIDEKAAYKNSMNRLLYSMLSDISKRELPWGILTGIRPTKLVYEMLEKGVDEHGIYGRMEDEYLCSKDKVKTSILIANREMQLLNELNYKSEYSLYIGIPFCPSTCLYCSFSSYSMERYADLVEDYLDALEKEIRYGATCFPNKKLSAVYLGGGTPTTLSAKQLDRLLGLIRELYDFTNVKEFLSYE